MALHQRLWVHHHRSGLCQLLFATDQWRRLVPTSWIVVTQAWRTFVVYANFHLPPEPNGFYGYNALQQLAYFAVVFIFGPLSILTGIAMSPALANRFPLYPRLFGGRQAARSIHFVLLLGYIAFLIVHVTLVTLTGFARNMNHIVLGTDDQRPARHDSRLCWYCGRHSFMDSGSLHFWRFPRTLQHMQKAVSQPLRLATLNRLLRISGTGGTRFRRICGRMARSRSARNGNRCRRPASAITSSRSAAW